MNKKAPALPAGVEGPEVPLSGASVEVDMDECPSCGTGDVAGYAWLIGSGTRKGTVGVECRVCFSTFLGRTDDGRARPLTGGGVAGATNMILRAIEADRRAPMQTAFLRLSVLRGKREILSDLRDGHFPVTAITCFSDLHDHRDANEYGGLCDAEYLAAWGIPHDLELAAAARVQEELDGWIQEGGLSTAEAGAPAHDDGTCPACGSSDVEGNSFEVDSGYAYQPMGCPACAAAWRNVYEFSHSEKPAL